MDTPNGGHFGQSAKEVRLLMQLMRIYFQQLLNLFIYDHNLLYFFVTIQAQAIAKISLDFELNLLSKLIFLALKISSERRSMYGSTSIIFCPKLLNKSKK
jgi:hypothetical protein